MPLSSLRKCADSRRTAHRRVHLGWGLVCAIATACAQPGVDPDGLGRTETASTVGDYVSGTCSTSVVLGLSTQIADEVNCTSPGTLASFTEGGGISFTGSAVLPYLAADAKADLLAAAAAHGGGMQVNSAYRTVAQQYLLYRWYQAGNCGITAAATPGTSNHETGRAVDLQNYSEYVGDMGANGWAHDVPGDPVHFDHNASPDLRGADVLAFQRLWNRNHPGDTIAEDGAYGPMTGARLSASPAGGFAIGACPPPPPPPGMPDFAADRAGNELPSELQSGQRVTASISMKNTGTQTWHAGATFLGTTHDQDHASSFFDAATWIAPNRAATVDHDTAPGEIGKFTFAIAAPDVAQDTMISETFGLVEEGVTWFGPDDLTIAILVHPPGATVVPIDPGATPGGDGGGLGGGCAVVPSPASSGGADAASLAGLAVAILALRRRRAR